MIVHQIWFSASPKPAPWHLIEGWKIMADSIGAQYMLHVEEDGWEMTPWMREAKFMTSKADMLRLEVLHRWGGVYVDADVENLAPLTPFFFENEWLVYENELESTLIGNHAMGLHAGSCFAADAMRLIKMGRTGLVAAATGPGLITEVAHMHRGIEILPACLFAPEFWNGCPAPGATKPIGRHYWATTRQQYEHLRPPEAPKMDARQRLVHELYLRGLRKVSGNMVR